MANAAGVASADSLICGSVLSHLPPLLQGFQAGCQLRGVWAQGCTGDYWRLFIAHKGRSDPWFLWQAGVRPCV